MNRRLLLVSSGALVILIAAFPWTPGFDIYFPGFQLSAHSLGNLGGALLVLVGLTVPWTGAVENLSDNILIWGLTLSYALVATSLKLKQHFSLQTHGGDLGIFASLSWNTLHGRAFWSPFHGDSFLAIHADLIFALLSPVFLLWKNAGALLVIQSVGLALSIPPIFILTRDISGKSSLALGAVLLFIGNPFILTMSQFDFHAEVLSIPVFLWAILALRSERKLLFCGLVAVALTIKEDQAFILAAWGFSLLFNKEHRWLGGFLILIGAAFFLLDTRWIIPSHVRPGETHHMMSRYRELGENYKEIAASLLNPVKLTKAFFLPWEKPWALARLFGSLLFLPILSVTTSLPAWAALLPHTLSNYDGQYKLTGSYPCSAFPFIFLAMAESLRRWRVNQSGRKTRAFVALSAIAGGMGVLTSPRFFDPPNPLRLESARRLLTQVPPEASLRAQSDLIPQLFARQHLQSFPFGALENDELSSLENPDYIAVDLKGNSFPFSRDRFAQAVKQLKDGGDYRLLFDENGYELWKRKASVPPVYIRHPHSY